MPGPACLGRWQKSLHAPPGYRPTPTLLTQRCAVLQHRRRCCRVHATIDYATGAPPTPKAPPAALIQEIRKALLQTGWQRAWIDGITDKLIKREFDTTAEQCKEVIAYLVGLGIPSNNVCNMAARAAKMLGRSVQQDLKPIVAYIEGKGVTGKALALLLSNHPKLLLYKVAGDGSQLELGPNARASVDVVEKNGQRFANASYWREGAAFQTAPLAPWKPSAKS